MPGASVLVMIMQTDQTLIKIENLKYCYETEEGEEPVFALNGIDLEIKKGEFVAIVGRNGSGKSTLATHLNALLVPTEGKVLVDGMDTADEDKIWDIRKKVGMVFQNPDNQIVSSVIEDDVAFGPENLGVPSAEIRERVDSSLKAVGMYDYRKKAPHLLSGGQKQRVAVAGVIAMQTECIVFDESTAMLDPLGRRDVMDIIKKLHQDGRTIVIITHFMEEAALADRIVVLADGKIAMQGTPVEIFKNEKTLDDLDLDVPFSIKMSAELRRRGLELPENIVTEEELADALCALK